MNETNFENRSELSSSNFHFIQNSEYAAFYYKPKNIFIPISLDNLNILKGQDNDAKKIFVK